MYHRYNPNNPIYIFKGFKIEGPSQAKLDCHDNEDGTADVTYLATTPGYYVIHILCDGEDIPSSPFVARILPENGKCKPQLVFIYLFYLFIYIDTNNWELKIPGLYQAAEVFGQISLP